MENINNIPEDFENLQKHAPALSRIERQYCFSVPEKYFDELPQHIQNIIYLLNLKNESTFEVPEAYFEQLPEHIRQQILLEGFKKENEFEVPENYFDNLSGKIQSRIFVESMKEENMEVPAGYFDELPNIIQQKISEQKATKVISIGTWFKTRYAYVAAAASIALLIGMFWFFSNDTVKPVQEIKIALTETEKEFVKENPELFNLDEALLAENISDEKLTELNLETLSKDDVLNYLSSETDLSSIIE